MIIRRHIGMKKKGRLPEERTYLQAGWATLFLVLHDDVVEVVLDKVRRDHPFFGGPQIRWK